MHRIFLLSPANCGGKRAALLLRERAAFELALRLRAGAVPLGEVFAFVSGLYFRGKLAYVAAFADPPAEVPAGLVITPSLGLLPPERPVTAALLRAWADIDVADGDPRFRRPLVRDVRQLAASAGGDCEFILLGSIATPKYLEPLTAVLGRRLLYPAEFAGRGDLSRGSIMLKAAAAGVPLTHLPAPGP